MPETLREVINKFDDLYTYVDEALKDVDKLLYELRKSCKEQIMVLGFYNPFTSFSKSLSTTVEPVIIYGNNKIYEKPKSKEEAYLNLKEL